MHLKVRVIRGGVVGCRKLSSQPIHPPPWNIREKEGGGGLPKGLYSLRPISLPLSPSLSVSLSLFRSGWFRSVLFCCVLCSVDRFSSVQFSLVLSCPVLSCPVLSCPGVFSGLSFGASCSAAFCCVISCCVGFCSGLSGFWGLCGHMYLCESLYTGAEHLQ